MDKIWYLLECEKMWVRRATCIFAVLNLLFDRYDVIGMDSHENYPSLFVTRRS